MTPLLLWGRGARQREFEGAGRGFDGFGSNRKFDAEAGADAAIGDALVVLANKGLTRANENLSYFVERQGNFGNLLTGDAAAAARYIECRLTPLAKDTLFNPALTRFVPSYDGRKEEPDRSGTVGNRRRMIPDRPADVNAKAL